MTVVDINSLLVETEAFMRTMHAVEANLGLDPTAFSAKHIATCINYADLIEMRAEFVRGLVNGVIDYVYSVRKQDVIAEDLRQRGHSRRGAETELLQLARQKFRPTAETRKGQVSELLLFILLQHHFKAAPLLRKMPIVTNPALERNGADAIHVARVDGQLRLYAGEAKTYASATDAMARAIESILATHGTLRSELNLYKYEEMIAPELEETARAFTSGQVNLPVHLVCLVAYHSERDEKGPSREDRVRHMIDGIEEDFRYLSKSKPISSVPIDLRPRLNLILFPIRALDKLIEQFSLTLGVPAA